MTLAPEGDTASEVETTRLYTVTDEGGEESALFPSGLVPDPTTGYHVVIHILFVA